MSARQWIVRRIIEETYAVDADNREQALELVAIKGEPARVRIIRETAKREPAQPSPQKLND